MKWIGDGIKQLPKNLKYFEFYLSHNNLGENDEHMRLLGEEI